MKKLVLSVLALGAMTSFAFAEPVKMTNVQLDETVAAGHKNKHGKFKFRARDIAVVYNDNDATATVNITADDGGKIKIINSTIYATASTTTKTDIGQ